MLSKHSDIERPRRGRPREFDRDAGLTSATKAFWAKGYKATSLAELTEKMGINPPSLYSAFGSKHDLFLACFDRYAETIGRRPTDAFENEPDFRVAVKTLFETTIRCATTPQSPRGCLIVSVATEMAAHDEVVQKKLVHAYAARVAIITKRVVTEQDAGRLPMKPDAERFAKMVISVTHSLVTRARVGASQNELSELATSFLDMMLPVPKKGR